MKNFLIKKKTENKNQKIDEYAIGEKRDLVDLVKNLPTQMKNREKKLNNEFDKKSLNPNRK